MATEINQFTTRLRKEIEADARNWFSDNWPVDEKGPEPDIDHYPILRRFHIRLRHNALTQFLGELYREQLRPVAREVALLLFPALVYKRQVAKFGDVSYLYDILDDEESRALLVKLFAYRIMGHKKVKLPRNTAEHYKLIEEIASLPIIAPPIKINFMDLSLQFRDLRPIGFSMKVYCTTGGGSYVFLQRQYEYHRGTVHCKAEPGDVVIDAGACWGETTLYFAHEVGSHGRVFAFEFIPSNLDVLNQNIKANPELALRITVVHKPLWNEADKTLYYVDWGPGSRVSFEKLREDFEDTRCQTTTIDQTVRDFDLTKLDMIKMDIEGAELNALKGAKHSIKRFHPKLAISLYHNIDDFNTIPRYLASLGLPYKYNLDHHTIYENETVLFAIPQKPPS